MPLVPYVPDLEAWKHHFKDQEYGKKFHVVKRRQKPDMQENTAKVVLNMVAPMDAALTRTKALAEKQQREAVAKKTSIKTSTSKPYDKPRKGIKG